MNELVNVVKLMNAGKVFFLSAWSEIALNGSPVAIPFFGIPCANGSDFGSADFTRCIEVNHPHETQSNHSDTDHRNTFRCLNTCNFLSNKNCSVPLRNRPVSEADMLYGLLFYPMMGLEVVLLLKHELHVA